MKGGWVAAAASLLAYTVITCGFGRDVLAQLGSTIANDSGDPLLTAAILKWSATHVPLTAPPTGHTLPAGTTWAFNSAHMAQITRQQPVRVAIHASELIKTAPDAKPATPPTARPGTSPDTTPTIERKTK